MYNLDTYNNYFNSSLPKAGPGGKVKGIKEFLKKFFSSSKNAKLKDLYKLSNQTGTVNNDFINKMKTLKISPDKFIESGKSPVSNDFVKLFSDRTWINRFGRDFSGVDEYNSLINLFKALPKHTAKPKQLLIDPLSNQPFGYNMAYHPKGDLYQSTFRNMATDIFPDIQNQMKYLNKHGIYHGDLKLNNIVLDENNVWKLIDPVGYPHASNLSSDVLKKIQQQEQARLKLMEEFLKKKKDGGEELPKAGPGGWIRNLMKLFSRSPKNKNINLTEFLNSKNLNIEDLTKTQGTPGSSLTVYNLGDDAVLKVPVSGQQRNRGIFANAFEPSPELVKTNRTTKIINRGDDFITTEKIIPYKPSSHSKVWSMDESKLLNDWASNWNFEGGLRYNIKPDDMTILINGLSNPAKYGQSEGFKKVYAQLVKNLKANNMEEFLKYPLENDFFKPSSWGKRTNIPYGKSTTEDFVNFDFGSIVGRNHPTMEKFFQNLGIRKEGGDLPKANVGGPKKWIKAFQKIFGNVDDVLPNNYNLTFNKIQDDLLLNQMKVLEQLKMKKFQLPFNQKTFYHGSRDPELIIKNMIKGRQLRGKNVKTGRQYNEEISPITGKYNFDLDQPGNALWWTPKIEKARGFHPHTYQADFSNIQNPYYMTTNTGNRVWSWDEMKKLIDEGYDAIIMNAKEKDPSSWFSASEIIPLDNVRVIQNLKKIQKKGGEQKHGIDRLLKNLENYKNKITVTKNTKRNKKVGNEYYVEIPHPSIKNQKLRVGSVNTNNSGGISDINIKDKFSTMGINTLLHNLAS